MDFSINTFKYKQIDVLNLLFSLIMQCDISQTSVISLNLLKNSENIPNNININPLVKYIKLNTFDNKSFLMKSYDTKMKYMFRDLKIADAKLESFLATLSLDAINPLLLNVLKTNKKCCITKLGSENEKYSYCIFKL